MSATKTNSVRTRRALGFCTSGEGAEVGKGEQGLFLVGEGDKSIEISLGDCRFEKTVITQSQNDTQTNSGHKRYTSSYNTLYITTQLYNLYRSMVKNSQSSGKTIDKNSRTTLEVDQAVRLATRTHAKNAATEAAVPS